VPRGQGTYQNRDGRTGTGGGFAPRGQGGQFGRVTPGSFAGRSGAGGAGGGRSFPGQGGAAAGRGANFRNQPGRGKTGGGFGDGLQGKTQGNRGSKAGFKNDKFDRTKDTEDGKRTRGKAVANKHPFNLPAKGAQQKQQEEAVKVITLPEILTIKELAEKMKLQPSAIVKKLFLQGKIVTINQEIDYETAEEIAMEYDVLCEKEVKVDVIEELLKEEEDDASTMVPRPPVVCVMGHVDHGKTSLLDAIRSTNVTAKEAGGITQHIGAYMVSIDGKKITFLDTPGHEAFTAMRMRGAMSTDIAILVVAADDGVMPQTIEAINHAKAAGVEIIVAINKIDKESANVERVKQELTEYELIPEEWGGSTIFVPVSAHTKEGIPLLLEMILLTAEIKDLRANPNRKGRGLVIEAELDKGKGPVATVLVQKGTLRVGDAIAAGSCHGKVRAMIDDKGKRVKEATPSMPVEILGLNDVPNAGEVFVATDSEKEARSFADTFISEGKTKLLEETKAKLSLDDLFSQIKAGNVKELPIVVKADVQGSVEAVRQSLVKLSNDEVVVKVIHGGVGAINESDVSLASASNAIVIGFNVRLDGKAKSIAEQEHVDLRLYKVIYQAIEDVEAAMKGMLDPIFEEQVIGHAVVRQTFKASGVGTIAGCYVLDGKLTRGCSARIMRGDEKIFEGAVASLKRFKDDVKEVATGYECGMVFEKFNDLMEDDQIEAYTMVQVER
jgi:translation initiation factor IF-2